MKKKKNDHASLRDEFIILILVVNFLFSLAFASSCRSSTLHWMTSTTSSIPFFATRRRAWLAMSVNSTAYTFIGPSDNNARTNLSFHNTHWSHTHGKISSQDYKAFCVFRNAPERGATTSLSLYIKYTLMSGIFLSVTLTT